MAGIFPGVCNTQNVDINGKPLVGAQLTVYTGGTLSPAAVYQDIGLAIVGQNPMNTNQTGRLPFFYVADGTYRVRLVDQYGVSIYDYPQVASIGASSSGGGGSAVDPTTVFATGDELFRKIGGARSGWVRQNSRTIGSGTSGASERANADCQNLFLYLWQNYPDAKCPVVGGRGVSAAADWAANKQITLPDMRGKGPHGIDGMGNSRANVIPDGNVTSGGGDTGDTDAAAGGEANHTLTKPEVPALAFSGNTGNDTPDHTHSQGTSGAQQAGGAGVNYANAITSQTGGASTRHTHPFSGNTDGGGGGHNNMAPFVLGTWYIKL